MQTQLSYFEDSYLFSGTGNITSHAQDEMGPYITLDSTIFHPQGGGQPSDVGTIEVGETINDIHLVRSKDGQIRHYTKQQCPDVIGKKASLSINEQMRRFFSRLHTGGHLLSLAVETLYPHWKAMKGHHYPESPYVEFVSQGGNTALVGLEAVNKEIADLIAKQYPIEAISVLPEQFVQLCPAAAFQANAPQIRLVRIGGFAYQPCGGTHVKNLKELAGLTACKQKLKGTTLRISYQFS